MSFLRPQVLPEGFNVGPEELWGLLEANARNTVFVVDGFDEDHSNQELREVRTGQSCVTDASRPS